MTRSTTPSTTWSSGRAATLSSLVAEQRLAEVARTAERRRSVEPHAHRLSTLASSARARLARALEAHAARADGRARTAPAGPNSQLVCCA